jgi:23S rRNA pseudouridine2457 synthase
MFHKPYGVVSQFSGGESRSTLKDFIDVPDVYPVGRLDHDSEGLMLLTDDGWLQHRLTDPRFGHPRTYRAQVEGIPDDRALQLLSRGIRIRDYQTLPANARLWPSEPLFPARDPPIRFRKNIPTAWIEITLTEGRNRQVRRMTAAVGYPTLRLVRVAIGDLRLEGLASGQWRDLTSAEVAHLRR